MSLPVPPPASATDFVVRSIGLVESELAGRKLAPGQPDEGAPAARKPWLAPARCD